MKALKLLELAGLPPPQNKNYDVGLVLLVVANNTKVLRPIQTLPCCESTENAKSHLDTVLKSIRLGLVSEDYLRVPVVEDLTICASFLAQTCILG